MTTQTKMTTTKNFKRTTIAPCLEQITPTTYRARVNYKGTRYTWNTTNKRNAMAWITQVRTTGNTAPIVTTRKTAKNA